MSATAAAAASAHACAACGAPGATSACNTCLEAHYCSKECFARDWKSGLHPPVCNMRVANFLTQTIHQRIGLRTREQNPDDNLLKLMLQIMTKTPDRKECKGIATPTLLVRFVPLGSTSRKQLAENFDSWFSIAIVRLHMSLWPDVAADKIGEFANQLGLGPISAELVDGTNTPGIAASMLERWRSPSAARLVVEVSLRGHTPQHRSSLLYLTPVAPEAPAATTPKF